MEDKERKQGKESDNVEGKTVTGNTLTPMTGVIADIKDRGYTMEFIVRDGKLKDMGSEKTFDPENLRIANEFRFEDTTDPDYMSILYTIESNKGDKGYISNAYGPYADTEVNEFIKKIERIEGKDLNSNKEF